MFLCNIVLYSTELYFHHQVLSDLGIVSALAQPLRSAWSYFLFFSSSILDAYWHEGSMFQCHIFLPFILFMGFSRQECKSGLPFPSPVNCILSEIFTMICWSWVALHGMALNFIQFYKAVIHVIILVNFLYSICPLKDVDKRLVQASWWEELAMGKTGSCRGGKDQSVQFSHPVVSDIVTPEIVMPGFPVHHQLPEFAQTHVLWVRDAIQPIYPLSLASPAFNISQHQGLFQRVSFSYPVAKVLQLQL